MLGGGEGGAGGNVGGGKGDGGASGAPGDRGRGGGDAGGGGEGGGGSGGGAPGGSSGGASGSGGSRGGVDGGGFGGSAGTDCGGLGGFGGGDGGGGGSGPLLSTGRPFGPMHHSAQSDGSSEMRIDSGSDPAGRGSSKRSGVLAPDTPISSPFSSRMTTDVTASVLEPFAPAPCTGMANEVTDALTGLLPCSVPDGMRTEAALPLEPAATPVIGAPSTPLGLVAERSFIVTSPSPTAWSSSPASMPARTRPDRPDVMLIILSAFGLMMPRIRAEPQPTDNPEPISPEPQSPEPASPEPWSHPLPAASPELASPEPASPEPTNRAS
mmetsp:Transcript_23878/g.79336  ORF Transcript_23878/g.79336 Transcript_23878/m.79336 type:complete len:325 (+) Transcript_23878:3209-4183(+)